MKKTLIIFFTAFLMARTANLLFADLAFAKGYRAKRLGKFDLAVALLESAIRLNKHEPTYYRELAEIYCLQGRQDDCLRNSSLALRLNQRNLLTLKSLTKTFIRAGLREDALLMAEKAVALCPTDWESRQLREYVLGLGG